MRSWLPRLRSARVWRLWLWGLRGVRMRNLLDLDPLGVDPGLLTKKGHKKALFRLQARSCHVRMCRSAWRPSYLHQDQRRPCLSGGAAPTRSK